MSRDLWWVQLLQKPVTSRRLVHDFFKNSIKSSTDSTLAAKLAHISELLDRLHYAAHHTYTLLRGRLSDVSEHRRRLKDVYFVTRSVQFLTSPDDAKSQIFEI